MAVAATQTASLPALDTPEGVVAVFTHFLLPGNGLGWAAEQLLTAGTVQDVVRVEATADTRGRRSVTVLDNYPLPPDQFGVGLFRSLLVRLIGVGRSETGADLNPYGDRFSLRRNGVELHLDIANTPALQRLQIVRATA